MPDLHLEVVVDVPKNEVRLVVANVGGPAREVRVLGVLGSFGFVGTLPPTSQWSAGERRTFRVSMPVPRGDPAVHAFVDGRDLAKRFLVIGTAGGATYRWPLRKASKMSAASQWSELFPGVAGPLDVQHSPMNIELIDVAR